MIRPCVPLSAVFLIGQLQAVHAAEGLQPFSPFVADSFKCQASDDKGATCDRTVCTNAPANYAYWKDSLSLTSISGAGNGSRWCRMTFGDMRNVPVSVPAGGTITVQLPGQICVNAHAETGSGVGNISVTAWNQCQLTGQWVQISP